ncbi:MAG: hypothetical protein GY793_05950 [Proteobacteria bacterium]|nr:hypothetical protein [Pseudomonadota bacterium]
MKEMQKTVLLYCAGGAHAHLIKWLVGPLKAMGYNVVVVSFETGPSIFASEGIECLSTKDFVNFDKDQDVVRYGKECLRIATSKRTQDTYGPTSDEQIAFLGLSCKDLVTEYGGGKDAEDKAYSIFDTEFVPFTSPTTFVKRVLGAIKPHMVITTGKAGAEITMNREAKQQGIKTIQIPVSNSLFQSFENLLKNMADLILCLNKPSAKRLTSLHGVPANIIKATGTPDLCSGINAEKPSAEEIALIKKGFGMNPSKKYVLVMTQLVVMTKNDETGEGEDVFFTNDSSLKLLDDLNEEIKKLDGWELVVKHHTNQPEEIFREWCLENGAVYCDNPEKGSLMEFISASDIVFGLGSTVLMTAYNAGKPVIALAMPEGHSSSLCMDDRKGFLEIATISDFGEAADKLIGMTITDPLGYGDALERVCSAIEGFMKKAA